MGNFLSSPKTVWWLGQT